MVADAWGESLLQHTQQPWLRHRKVRGAQRSEHSSQTNCSIYKRGQLSRSPATLPDLSSDWLLKSTQFLVEKGCVEKSMKKKSQG